MRSITRLAAALALAFSSVAVQAQVYYDYVTSYSNLAWDFVSSQSGFTGCTTLYLDVAGNFTNGDHYAMYGKLYCPSLGGFYNVDGSGYFSGNTFNLSVELGVSHKLVCTNISSSSLSGSCQIYNNTGSVTGTASITFL